MKFPAALAAAAFRRTRHLLSRHRDDRSALLLVPRQSRPIEVDSPHRVFQRALPGKPQFQFLSGDVHRTFSSRFSGVAFPVPQSKFLSLPPRFPSSSALCSDKR